MAMPSHPLKVSLSDLTDIARQVLNGPRREVIAVLPASGDSAYAEIVVDEVSTTESGDRRRMIGVSRSQTVDGVRDDIARKWRTPGVSRFMHD
jgi:hypothetical protein